MSAPVDVRAVLDVRRHLGVKQSTKNANAAFLDWRDWCNYLPQADKASAAVDELIEAASTYFNGYCVDEAEDDFEDSVFGLNTGCTPEQHEDAKRLRAALANVGGQP
jgi:hypothetical protein